MSGDAIFDRASDRIGRQPLGVAKRALLSAHACVPHLAHSGEEAHNTGWAASGDPRSQHAVWSARREIRSAIVRRPECRAQYCAPLAYAARVQPPARTPSRGGGGIARSVEKTTKVSSLCAYPQRPTVETSGFSTWLLVRTLATEEQQYFPGQREQASKKETRCSGELGLGRQKKISAAGTICRRVGL